MLKVTRYASNRKYYASSMHRHMTLKDINDWVSAGGVVQVIDKSNNKDITQAVLIRAKFYTDIKQAASASHE